MRLEERERRRGQCDDSSKERTVEPLTSHRVGKVLGPKLEHRIPEVGYHNGFIFAVAVGEGEDNFLSKNLFYRYLHTIEYI